MSFEQRHQVFLSSTFEDLKDERQAVTLTLLEHKCIPAGMELFPAGDFDPWEVIKDVIAQSDYYIVIIAGKYGSCPRHSTISFTEREFRYAESLKKPIAAFIRENIDSLPAKFVERSRNERQRLDRFIARTKKKLVRPWKDTGALVSHVSSAINSLKATTPMPGWIRADASSVLTPLQDQIEEIKRELSSRRRDGHRDAARHFDNHSAAQGEMRRVIESIAKSNDVIRLRAMGLSLAYTWPFLEEIIRSMSTSRRLRFDIELAIGAPKYLDQKGLSRWSKKALATLSAIEELASKFKPIKDGRTRILVSQYENLPHWHGMLINDSVLFLGRSHWEFDEVGMPPQLYLGQMSYRLFFFDDLIGGADRIALFRGWFRYYRSSAVQVAEYGELTAE